MAEYPLKSIRFPSGLQIACLPGSDVETRFLYNEIFVEDVYFRHGIKVQDGDTVLDVGANIGMFSVYLLQKFPQLRLFAFEPVPPTAQALQANIETLGLRHTKNVRLLPYGISNESDSR